MNRASVVAADDNMKLLIVVHITLAAFICSKFNTIFQRMQISFLFAFPIQMLQHLRLDGCARFASHSLNPPKCY